MMNIMRTKKGFGTIVTIFSIMLLALIFIVFFWLFSKAAKDPQQDFGVKYSSVNAELLLKTFLRMPAPDTSRTPIEDKAPDIDKPATNADLVSWTCDDDKKSRNYRALKESINTYFVSVYGDDWEIEIFYPHSGVNSKLFGRKSLLEKLIISAGLAEAKAQAFKSGIPGAKSTQMFLQYKGPGYASQVIPCLDGGFAVLIFKTDMYG